MITIDSVARMGDESRRAHGEGRRIGLVPTMGFLHEGHVALMRRTRELSDLLVVSIFVNPTQFGPGEDYDRYPRDLERDTAVCRAAGVGVLFCPNASDMYREGHSVYVEETALSRRLCGAFRPGHFRGVATVVAKLFNMVRPDVAVFGQKDAQQVSILARMVRDLNFPVDIVTAPTVREVDGLAMSSRNAYLSEPARSRAPCLYQSLQLAERLYGEGVTDAREIAARMRAHIEKHPPVSVEYIDLSDIETLQPVDRITGRVLVAVAVRMDGVRLIDNTIIGG